MSKNLIINADDYGITSEVSRGIRLAYTSGVLTSTTVMAIGLSCEEDLQLLQKECPAMGVGVHLTLTTFKPISKINEVASLINDKGNFYRLNELKTAVQNISPEELYNEWVLQVDKIISFGLNIDHLDSHHNAAYLSTTTFEVFKAIAKQFSLPVRLPMSPVGNLALETSAKASLDAAAVKSPDQLNFDFAEAADKRASLVNLLEKLNPGTTEVLCHPGFIDKELRSISSLLEPRQLEIEALCAPEIRQVIQKQQIELTTYGRLFK